MVTVAPRYLVLCAFLVAAFSFTAADAAEPVTLFDGKTLDGWDVLKCEAVVQDGVILLKAGNGLVQSEKQYGDYVLEYEWKARQQSEAAEKPLVIYEGRSDDPTLRTLVSAPEVAALVPGFVWHRPADADPGRRELAVYAWDDPALVLIGPLDLSEVDAEELAELLQEALDENPGTGRGTTSGVMGFTFPFQLW